MKTLLPALRSGSFLSPLLTEVLADTFDQGWQSQPNTGFKLDVLECKDKYLIYADLPGLRSDQVEVTLHNGAITIEVRPQSLSDTEASYLVRERSTEAMIRTVMLPFALSGQSVDAAMKDGVLTVTIRKDEAEMPKKITVH